MRKAKALGVIRQIEEAHPIEGRVLLRKYYCLALLPADMIPAAFESLQVISILDPNYVFNLFSIFLLNDQRSKYKCFFLNLLVTS